MKDVPLPVIVSFLNLFNIEGIEAIIITEVSLRTLMKRTNLCKTTAKSKNVPLSTPYLVTLNSTEGLIPPSAGEANAFRESGKYQASIQ